MIDEYVTWGQLYMIWIFITAWLLGFWLGMEKMKRDLERLKKIHGGE